MGRIRPIAACGVLAVLSCVLVARDLAARAAPEGEAAPAAADAAKPGTSAADAEDGRTAEAAPRFKVQLARIGSGFEAGISGVLRIAQTGLDFIPTGQARMGWAVLWRDLVEARTDEHGFWDSPHPPLLLIERGGRRHYLARIDVKGRHLPVDPVLAAIAEARLRHKAANQIEPAKPDLNHRGQRAADSSKEES